MQTEKRRAGDEAEGAAARFLESAGYTIRHRNFMCQYGEIDLVAERETTVAFVEVRMRRTAVQGVPSATVHGLKQRKVVKAALHYLFRHGIDDRMVRFDVVSVIGTGQDARVEHIPDAFDAGM